MHQNEVFSASRFDLCIRFDIVYISRCSVPPALYHWAAFHKTGPRTRKGTSDWSQSAPPAREEKPAVFLKMFTYVRSFILYFFGWMWKLVDMSTCSKSIHLQHHNSDKRLQPHGFALLCTAGPQRRKGQPEIGSAD